MALRNKGPLDEEDDWLVLLKKAEKFEMKESQKITTNQEKLLTLGRILDDAYVVRRPNPSEYQYRRELIRVFNEIARELYGNGIGCPVIEEFGSFSMDLFTTGSDLDLSINFSNRPLVFPRDQTIKTLRKFAKKFYALQSGGHVCGVLPVLTAKVPILKVVDVGTGIECDLSVENRDGILKSAIIHLICSIDERFHKLSFLMKAWAKSHDINSSKDRTLNSLSVILLVAFHLQTRDPPILPPFSAILKDGVDLATVEKSVKNFENYGKRNTESLSELFFSFFIKLASVEKLWPKGLCASPHQGRWISKTWANKIASMSVEDFTDNTQNVARAVGKGEVEGIYSCIHLTIHNLISFMNGQMEESKLNESLFGNNNGEREITQARPQANRRPKPKKVKPLKRPVENNRSSQQFVTTNPVLTMNKVFIPNGWTTLSAPATGRWEPSRQATMTSESVRMAHESLWSAQPVMPVDHRSTKRMRSSEGQGEIATVSIGGPPQQGWRGPDIGDWGGLGYRQGWGAAGSWGEIQRGDSMVHVPQSQERQPTDHWGRNNQQPPPTGTSSFSHGPPFR